MKPLTVEWVEKAENDWNSLNREIRVRKNPNYDAVCFFAQQCVEKYIKARLVEADIYFKKTNRFIPFFLKMMLQNIFKQINPQRFYLHRLA